MARRRRFLRFAWWNLNNFAHFDPAAPAQRGAQDQRQYDRKQDRVLAALAEMFGGDFPDLLAVCEITRQAADGLLARLPAGYELRVPPTYPRDDGFQVAVYYKRSAGLTPELPLLATREDKRGAGLPDETRPMPVVHFTSPDHVIRFIACHWTGFSKDSSTRSRRRLATFLRQNIYAYLHPDVPTSDAEHHVVVLGDLNVEPTWDQFRPEGELLVGRDRQSARREYDRARAQQISQVHLYNTAWRFLGEQRPHGGRGPDAAGTYYHREHGWRTLDHLLVTGGLLGPDPPFLDEAETRIMVTEAMVDDDGLPAAFDPRSDPPRGVSDHLPIVGRIALP